MENIHQIFVFIQFITALLIFFSNNPMHSILFMMFLFFETALVLILFYLNLLFLKITRINQSWFGYFIFFIMCCIIFTFQENLCFSSCDFEENCRLATMTRPEDAPMLPRFSEEFLENQQLERLKNPQHSVLTAPVKVQVGAAAILVGMVLLNFIVFYVNTSF